MSNRRTDIAVGTFILVGIALTLGGIFVMKGNPLVDTNDYFTDYQNVGAITKGSSVKYHGYQIGRVTELDTQSAPPGQVRVHYTVRSPEDGGPNLTTDYIAHITKPDILGDPFIDLRLGAADTGSRAALSGEAGGQPLTPGQEIDGREPFDFQGALEELRVTLRRADRMLGNAEGELDTALVEINGILKDAHALFSDENRENIAAALDGVAATTAQLRVALDDNRQHLDSIFSNVDSASGNLNSLSADAKDTVADLRPDLEELTVKLQSAVVQLEGALQSASSTLEAFDVEQVNEVVENLDTASRNLAEFTHEIKQRPYRLIRKEKQPPKEFR